MESLSLNVALAGSFLTVSKSMVIPKGIAISSVLAYLRPILPEESSTLCDTFTLSSSSAIESKLKRKFSFFSQYKTVF